MICSLVMFVFWKKKKEEETWKFDGYFGNFILNNMPNLNLTEKSNACITEITHCSNKNYFLLFLQFLLSRRSKKHKVVFEFSLILISFNNFLFFFFVSVPFFSLLFLIVLLNFPSLSVSFFFVLYCIVSKDLCKFLIFGLFLSFFLWRLT